MLDSPHGGCRPILIGPSAAHCPWRGAGWRASFVACVDSEPKEGIWCDIGCLGCPASWSVRLAVPIPPQSRLVLRSCPVHRSRLVLRRAMKEGVAGRQHTADTPNSAGIGMDLPATRTASRTRSARQRTVPASVFTTPAASTNRASTPARTMTTAPPSLMVDPVRSAARARHRASPV